MSICVSVKKRVELPHALAAVYGLLADVKTSCECMSGVERVTPLGGDRFDFLLRRQGLDGVKSMTFQGAYVSQYWFEPGLIRWESVSGNMESRGRYALEPHGAGVAVTAELTNVLPLKVPPILRAPVEMLVRHELLKTVVDMLKKLPVTQ